MAMITAEQTAERLGISVRRVQAMVMSGRLPASRFGRALAIDEADLALVADRRPGRPPKAESAKNSRKPAKKARKARKR
jgi:excisionase family DNA binding protein